MTTQTSAPDQSIACRLAGRGKGHFYYIAREWKDEWRIRVFRIMGDQLLGIDHLLSDSELKTIGLDRTAFACSSTHGPGGIVLPKGSRRYHTCFAVAVAVSDVVGLRDANPIGL